MRAKGVGCVLYGQCGWGGVVGVVMGVVGSGPGRRAWAGAGVFIVCVCVLLFLCCVLPKKKAINSWINMGLKIV